MTLEELRRKAFFQNTVDVWIAYSEERKWDWYDIDAYRRFISHLKLSKFSSDDAAAYTVKLSGDVIATIRSFAN